MLKKMKKKAMLATIAAAMTLSLNTNVFAKQINTQPTSYQTVTQIEDWGAATTKVIVNVGKPIPKNSVTTDTFKVHVARSDQRLKKPFLGEGDRTITKAYVADKDGNPVVQTGKYVVLEMKIGPTDSLGSPLNYDWATTGFNDWVDMNYTITQQRDIETSAGTISGLVVDQFAGETRELVDDFSTGKGTYDNVSLSYADFSPKTDNHKNPLIIWLHGAGEGGTDPTIPISANKAANFASKDIQSKFDGAYVLAPQTPTFWMDGLKGFGDGTSKYENALMSLIKEYVANHKDVDTSRIYIGGDSNGGYMTMLMARDYTNYFAAAFPTCEALKDTLITDTQIQKMKDLPMWLIAAKTDPVVKTTDYIEPTYQRLVDAGAKNVHESLFDKVVDTSGLYKNADGTPYEYNGHWSWIYVYNNVPTDTINGKTTHIMEWLAAQTNPNTK
ncbi:prolyl oligopeptidase family serine peptidase [Neobacillus cucumis]|uniref:prolyl oligopeptidase family serine peptidase n=1 Tax=Neobacillus cucumis TaxID=1740721 RepID=UPI0028535CF1|nr:prolyl oligopeptidase family serine peptidase [Neobacillus cucumis]MDR4945355.1 prolyl oligopeptidase family serine peptidase [Neobacillus cucumis]